MLGCVADVTDVGGVEGIAEVEGMLWKLRCCC